MILFVHHYVRCLFAENTEMYTCFCRLFWTKTVLQQQSCLTQVQSTFVHTQLTFSFVPCPAGPAPCHGCKYRSSVMKKPAMSCLIGEMTLLFFVLCPCQ